MSVVSEITLVASNGLRGALGELVPKFAAATGHKVTLDLDVMAVLKPRLDAGAFFDVAILSPELIDGMARQGKIAAGTRVDVARTGLGLAVRRGAPKPDIGTTEALKRALLNAQSIGYPKDGGSGAYFLAALERLGIAVALKPKLQPFEGAGTIRAVAAGTVEMVGIGMGPIMNEPGAELVGALPAAFQTYVYFAGGVSAQTKAPAAAGDLLRFLTAPAAAPVLKAKGLEPI